MRMNEETPVLQWLDAKEHPEWIAQRRLLILQLNSGRYYATRCPQCEGHRFVMDKPKRWMIIPE